MLQCPTIEIVEGLRDIAATNIHRDSLQVPAACRFQLTCRCCGAITRRRCFGVIIITRHLSFRVRHQKWPPECIGLDLRCCGIGISD